MDLALNGFKLKKRFIREALVEAVLASSVRKILVPHGTFTMTETAQVVEKAMMESENQKKAIVLVGSLVPLGDPSSDAPDNLAVALHWIRSNKAILITPQTTV